MLDHLFLRPRVRDRIRANPLGAWLPNYIAYLDARGHPRSTIRRCVRAVEHFGTWLDSQHIAPEDVTRTTIRSFLRDHLPLCHCPTPAPTYPRQVRAALGHLLRLPSGPLHDPGPHPHRPRSKRSSSTIAGICETAVAWPSRRVPIDSATPEYSFGASSATDP
jgi:hypothetical protein